MDVESRRLALIPSDPSHPEATDPRLELSLTTHCPSCQAASAVDRNRGMNPRDVTGLRGLELLVDSISAERHCDNCGIPSIIPPKVQLSLTEWIFQEATVEALKAGVAEMGYSFSHGDGTYFARGEIKAEVLLAED